MLPVAQAGRGSPVHLQEDQPLVVTPANARALLLAYLAGDFSAATVAYVADALGLSEHVEFAPAQVRNVLERTTDPEINGPFDEQTARALLEQLAGLPLHY